MGSATIVRQQLGVQVLNPEPGWTRGELRYDPADPYALVLWLSQPDESVEWRFARDLLLDGFHATVEAPATDPYDVGDVRVWRQWLDGRDLVVVRLSSPDGVRAAALARQTVAQFLDVSLRKVPRGKESRRIDWVRETAHLLEPGKPRPL